MTRSEKTITWGLLGLIAWELWQSGSVQAAVGAKAYGVAASTCSPNDSMVTEISQPVWIAALGNPKSKVWGIEGLD